MNRLYSAIHMRRQHLLAVWNSLPACITPEQQQSVTEQFQTDTEKATILGINEQHLLPLWMVLCDFGAMIQVLNLIFSTK